MDDLIYSYLLQSDYPRASIVFDADLLLSNANDNRIKVPAFIIVDPQSTDACPLAVIEVVDALDGDELRDAAIETGAYASRLGGKHIQGFVVRVDVHGRTEAEKVQFYKIWPNSSLQQLSSKTFPDLNTLRVARILAVNSSPIAVSDAAKTERQDVDIDQSLGLNREQDDTFSPGAGLYIPALLLLLVLIVDTVFTNFLDTPLISVAQSILAIGAACLLTLPSALKLFRS